MSNLEWCRKQPKGLRLITPNNNLSSAYLRKSISAPNILSSAIEKEEPEWVLETSYYAKYFAAYALLTKAGLKSEIHDCTIAVLREVFIDEKIVPEKMVKELTESKEARVGSLYYDKELDQKRVLMIASSAPIFCLEMEFIIDTISPNKINQIRKRFLT